MKIAFTEAGWQDYLWFQETDRKLLKKINTLITEIQRNPFEGIGKPEPLKANLSGYWSRRISTEHRLVYKVAAETIVIVACRFHYQNLDG
jgi:toxin YoeB